ncbi:MAG: hypothetical protein ACRC7O_08285 [Fimbriiglobus sp.]
MAYNQFTLQRVQADFGLTLHTVRDLFPAVAAVPVPRHVRENLPDFRALAVGVGTEAARSQLLIAPLLVEVWRAEMTQVALFIGTRFDVDDTAGLTGVCDFILGYPPQLHFVSHPVMMIAEAKNDDMNGGLGQCAAAMVAAERFNRGRTPAVPVVFGAVSDGERWRFLRLRESVLDLELTDRLISDINQIFGILLHIVGVTPPSAAAA